LIELKTFQALVRFTATRDGDQEIHVLTNLPSKVSAVRVADLYRQSWTLEQAFNELTTHLRCELNTLVYPKAALFAFWVAAKQLQRTGRSQKGAAWRAWRRESGTESVKLLSIERDPKRVRRNDGGPAADEVEKIPEDDHGATGRPIATVRKRC
jgi:IS4 transposase